MALLSTMGDARTEHLLLAAKKVRSMRAQDDRVGRLTLEELKRGGVIGPDGGVGYAEGYEGVILPESSDDSSDDEDVKGFPLLPTTTSTRTTPKDPSACYSVNAHPQIRQEGQIHRLATPQNTFPIQTHSTPDHAWWIQFLRSLACGGDGDSSPRLQLDDDNPRRSSPSRLGNPAHVCYQRDKIYHTATCRFSRAW